MKRTHALGVFASRLNVPKLRHHKPSGRAVVTLNLKDHYVGAWGTKAAVEEYERLVSVWLANGRRLETDSQDISVAELSERYLEFAKGFYRTPDGRQTGEVDLLTRAVNIAVAMFGTILAAEFGPMKLKAVRERWISEGRVRTQINYAVRRIVRMFRWGVENELLRGDVLHALRAVPGLKAGRSDAKEAPPVSPAPEGDVEKVLEIVTSPIRGMIEVQRLTGCRPGEVVQMTADRIDRTKPIWVYRPRFHKTQHHGRDRVIFIGPRCQEVLRPFIENRPEGASLFSPKDAMAEFRARRHAARATPMNQGNKPGTNLRSKLRKKPRDAYDVQSYGNAIAYACKKADVPVWSPNQLRHLAATRIRALHGLEAAQVLLGHARADVTQIYAERDALKAAAVAAQMG